MASKVGAPLLRKPLKVAAIQLATGSDKTSNLSVARSKVLEASSNGAKLVVLPECFNSPYGTQFFPTYAESLDDSPSGIESAESYQALAEMSREAQCYLVGGSIPEHDPTKNTYYNTSLIFSPEGALLAKHRKAHLFDIDIPGKIRFQESEVLSAGDQITTVELPEYGKIAIAICYDIRFPEMSTVAARRGCFGLIFPGAFNMTTGPLHQILQIRARAMDNQVYAAWCSPARDMDQTYHAYGHSALIDPSAVIMAEAEETPTILYAEWTNARLEEVRKGIPLDTQRRFDIYSKVETIQHGP